MRQFLSTPSITYEVPGHAASILSQRHEDQRKYRGTHIPATSRPVQIREWLVLNMEQVSHVVIPGTI